MNVQIAQGTGFGSDVTARPINHMGTWSYDIDNDTMLWSDPLYSLYDVDRSFAPTLDSMLGLAAPGGQCAGAALADAISDGASFEVQYPIFLRSGAKRRLRTTGCVHVRNGKPARILGTTRDVTTLAKNWPDCESDVEFTPQSMDSDLSDLDGILQRAEVVAEASGCEFAMLCFSAISGLALNAELPDGDVAINDLLSRLRPDLDGIGSLIQLDGDTLILFVERVEGDEDLARLCSKFKAEFDRPICLLDGAITVAYRLEVFRGPGGVIEFSSSDADDEVGQSERLGKSDNAITTLVRPERRNLKLVTEMREAQAADQFVVAYQPKIDFRKGAVAGFEALIRWQHPVKGLLGPSSFHQAFGDPEVENALSNMILEKVIRQLSVWSEIGVEFNNIAVNVSSGQLHESGFFERFIAMTEENAIRPSQLKMEIREDVLLSDSEHAICRTLNCIKQAGFSTALDDFGRGNARWSDISGSAVDVLKIDRSLVTNLLDDRSKMSLVKSIIDLAHDLDLEVIAEGIETASVDRTLKNWGCDLGQGYAYARPMLAEAIPAFIEQWKTCQSSGGHLHLISDIPAAHGLPDSARQ